MMIINLPLLFSSPSSPPSFSPFSSSTSSSLSPHLLLLPSPFLLLPLLLLPLFFLFLTAADTFLSCIAVSFCFSHPMFSK